MNSYSFQPFLDGLGDNWFRDDPLLTLLLHHHAGPDDFSVMALEDWGREVAGPLRKLAERSAQAEGLPRIQHFDAYRRRVDRIVLPDSTVEALGVAHGREKLGAPHGNPFEFYARGYLYAQNGEAGVGCSLGCTDGMVRVLEALGDHDVHREAVTRVRSSTPDRVWHGAQFVTEIQGGSDVPANRTEAREVGGEWRLHGRKWFCSNVNADYYLVTARPRGVAGGDPSPEGADRGPAQESRGDDKGRRSVALFLVPARLDEGAGPRNGHTVDRLKEKLGTRELATAEVTFEGALAFPVGPLEEGLPNLLRYVLTTSRFYCIQSAAAILRQTRRIGEAYAGFRCAFGRKVQDFPLARDRLDRIDQAHRRALAAYFQLLRLWEEDAPDFRILLSLAKPVLTASATRMAREAIYLLGGNGIEERFTPLPRLYRDALIMEIWEGPHDVLFTQALRDLRRFQVEPEAFMARVAGEDGRSQRLAGALAEILEAAGKEDASVEFSRLAPRIVNAFADRALLEAGSSIAEG